MDPRFEIIAPVLSALLAGATSGWWNTGFAPQRLIAPTLTLFLFS